VGLVRDGAATLAIATVVEQEHTVVQGGVGGKQSTPLSTNNIIADYPHQKRIQESHALRMDFIRKSRSISHFVATPSHFSN